MKGVIGMLLTVLGLEIMYLVLAGKLPLQQKKDDTVGSSGDFGGGPGDIRPYMFFSTPRRISRGMPTGRLRGLER